MNIIDKIKQKYGTNQYKGIKKAVLAYSGGLDTSVLLKLVPEIIGTEIITVTVDLGGKEYKENEFKEIQEKAKKLGAIKTYIINAKKEFVDGFVFKAIKANSLYQEHNANSTALGRYLISQILVEIAAKENADAIIHGSTGKGNDQVRFDISIGALSDYRVIAPIREWNLTRKEEILFAQQENIPIPLKENPYSVDANLWGKFTGGGKLEDPASELDFGVFKWVKPPVKAKDIPTTFKIHFKKGVPVSLELEDSTTENNPIKIIESLNELGAENGIGITNYVEDKIIGLKSREVYECPAAKILLIAHKDLEQYILTKEENEIKPVMEKIWSELVFKGLWFSPIMKSINAFIDSTQEVVNGWVKVQIYKGNVTITARHSENSIFNLDLVAYDNNSKFDQTDAIGFIKLWGLNTILANKIKTGVKK